MRAFALPLRTPLATGHGPIASRSGFLVCLEDEMGRVGFGEATPLAEFGTEDLSHCQAAVARALGVLADGVARDFDQALAASGIAAGAQAPCARAALDTALHDLEAKQAGRALADRIRARAGLLGEPAKRVRVQALISGQSPRAVASNARASVAAGFDAVKLKLAVSAVHRDLGIDLERVTALREAVGPERRIRLDANEAWDGDEAQVALEALEPFGIDFIEQPVVRTDLASLARLDAAGSIAVAADEALLGEGLEACLTARAASVFVLKPSAIGGISASLAAARRAREASVRIVWSNLIEGLPGRAAALSLAAGLDEGEEVHGLGTASLLLADLAISKPGETGSGEAGVVEIGSRSGLGCELVATWRATGGVFGEGAVFEGRT